MAMARGNQWTASHPRLHRLPGLAVTEDERRLVYELSTKYPRLTLADVIRLGLVAMGAFKQESLGPAFPEEMLAAAKNGEVLSILSGKKSKS